QTIHLLLFSNDPATTELYTLSLHDALPIYGRHRTFRSVQMAGRPDHPAGGRTGSRYAPARSHRRFAGRAQGAVAAPLRGDRRGRSEEHTSELQSRENLVCRLLLEKKNKTNK